MPLKYAGSSGISILKLAENRKELKQTSPNCRVYIVSAGLCVNRFGMSCKYRLNYYCIKKGLNIFKPFLKFMVLGVLTFMYAFRKLLYDFIVKSREIRWTPTGHQSLINNNFLINPLCASINKVYFNCFC